MHRHPCLVPADGASHGSTTVQSRYETLAVGIRLRAQVCPFGPAFGQTSMLRSRQSRLVNRATVAAKQVSLASSWYVG